MKALSRTIIASVLMVSVTVTSARAKFRFPMPEFASGYQYPSMHTPMPAFSMEWWDVVVLFLALSLAALLVLKRRSRREIFLLTVFSLVYFGFFRKGCVCAVGSIQNVVASLFGTSDGVPITVLAFFAMPLVFALFFGRVFCSAVCPLGAIQEAVALRPIIGLGPVGKVLRLVPYIYLGISVLAAATGAGFLICRYDPFVGFFRQGGGFNMLVTGGIILVTGIFIARPYCRFLCPYGVLLGWMSRVSKWHATITPAECVQCKLCEKSCPFDAINPPTPEQAPEPRKAGIRRLAILAALMPVLVLAGAGTGMAVHKLLARIHPTVALAERIAAEDAGKFTDMTIDSEAFRSGDKTTAELYQEAQKIRDQFNRGSFWFGGFIGFVIGCKLIGLSVVRKRDGYEPDMAHCYSCGRCFAYCPVKKET